MNNNQDQIAQFFPGVIAQFFRFVGDVAGEVGYRAKAILNIHDEHEQITINSVSLVLATRISASNQVDQLPLDSILDTASCEVLFRHSKYVWKGTRQVFEDQFLDLIIGKSVDLANLSDEYAFRLIALQVNTDFPGLDKNADTISRADAFNKLAGQARIIGVSPPLFSDSFEEKGFYKLV